MAYLIVKSALSGVIVALVSEIAKRSPGFGGLIASLLLGSLRSVMSYALGMWALPRLGSRT